MSEERYESAATRELKRLCGKKMASKGKTVLMIRTKLKEPTNG